MAASIRGHRGSLKVYNNGADAAIVNITKFEANQDSSFMRTFYAGNPVPEGDQTVEGWSGSMDLEVKDEEVDAVIDEIIDANQAGVGVPDMTLVLAEEYSDGRVASYVYFDVQMKMGKSSAGLNEKMTKKVDWQASGRKKL